MYDTVLHTISLHYAIGMMSSSYNQIYTESGLQV